MQATDKPRRSVDVSHEMVNDEAILIDLKTGTYYSLNDTGATFWEALDGQTSIADCAKTIAAGYDVEPELVEADLLELATEFKREGLIVV